MVGRMRYKKVLYSLQKHFEHKDANDALAEFLPPFFDELRRMSVRDKERGLPVRAWLGGTDDSNTTLFEEMCNECKVAVLARSKKVAACLLMLVRMLIDGQMNLIDEWLDHDFGRKDKVPMRIIVTKIARWEYTVLRSFSLEEGLYTKYRSGKTAHAHLDEASVYTLNTIEKIIDDTWM